MGTKPQQWTARELKRLLFARREMKEGQGDNAFIDLKVKVTPELLERLIGGVFVSNDGRRVHFGGRDDRDGRLCRAAVPGGATMMEVQAAFGVAVAVFLLVIALGWDWDDETRPARPMTPAETREWIRVFEEHDSGPGKRSP